MQLEPNEKDVDALVVKAVLMFICCLRSGEKSGCECRYGWFGFALCGLCVNCTCLVWTLQLFVIIGDCWEHCRMLWSIPFRVAGLVLESRLVESLRLEFVAGM